MLIHCHEFSQNFKWYALRTDLRVRFTLFGMCSSVFAAYENVLMSPIGMFAYVHQK